MKATTEQPVVRGRAHVDYGASTTQVKVTVWVNRAELPERVSPVWDEDEVEVRTVKRVATVTWGDDA